MNKSGFSGFRDSNPRDVLKNMGKLDICSFPKRSHGAPNVRTPIGSRRYQLMQSGINRELIGLPWATPTGYDNIIATDTSLIAHIRTGNSITVQISNASLTSWVSRTATLGSITVDFASNIFWLADQNQFVIFAHDQAANTLYGFFTVDFTSWTQFTVSASMTVQVTNINISATRDFVLVGYNLSSGQVGGWRIAKPLSGSPTITAFPAYITTSSVAGLNLTSNACMIGAHFTNDFITFTHAVYSQLTAAHMPLPHEPKSGFWLNYGNVVWRSPDGISWSSFSLKQFFGNNGGSFREVMTPAGSVFISEGGATFLDTNMFWIYDVKNRAEADYSGAMPLFMFRGDIYCFYGTSPSLYKLTFSGSDVSPGSISSRNRRVHL